MRSTTTRRTAALCCAALALAAAAGCSSSKSSDSITGARTAPPSLAASAAPSPTATRPAGAPEVTLPADLKVTVQFPATGDAAKDAVAQSLTYALRAYNGALAKSDPQDAAFKYAWDGMARSGMADMIGQLVGRNQTVTGETRFYAPTITVTDADHAAATYCEDQSKGYAKDKASGRALTTTLSIRDFTEWNLGLEKSAQGVWRVTQARGEKGSTRCQKA
ncbi:hypothetical protein [Kitasatospora sp. NPDC085879]|uniref:hypothetical protein n=1 Tax=Kitasatospora sp. NPDC085879 TaxID=3154769 RepID=UPI000BB160A3|nr:hypothetical protein [Streptomyces sp. TLI_235]PBC69827.1 hypothetical protein BX265_7185 [Streptomyces sp. TLI_235]